jgi:hypothetical protein
MPALSLPLVSRVGAIGDRITDRIRGFAGGAAGRVVTVVAGVAGFAVTMAVEGSGLVGTVVGLPGQLVGVVTGLPGMAMSAVASLLPGFVLAGAAVVADRPLLAVIAVLLAGVAWTNWLDRGATATWLIRAALLALVGFVASFAIGPGLVSELGGAL